MRSRQVQNNYFTYPSVFLFTELGCSVYSSCNPPLVRSFPARRASQGSIAVTGRAVDLYNYHSFLTREGSSPFHGLRAPFGLIGSSLGFYVAILDCQNYYVRGIYNERQNRVKININNTRDVQEMIPAEIARYRVDYVLPRQNMNFNRRISVIHEVN